MQITVITSAHRRPFAFGHPGERAVIDRTVDSKGVATGGQSARVARESGSARHGGFRAETPVACSRNGPGSGLRVSPFKINAPPSPRRVQCVGGAYDADLPPSTDTNCPVRKRAWSEARNRPPPRSPPAALARSRGTAARNPAWRSVAAGEAVQHAGLHRAGRHGVDAHAEAATSAPPPWSDLPPRACWPRKTRRPARRSGRRRGDVDDAAITLRQHHAQLVLHAEQRAEHIGVEGGR